VRVCLPRSACLPLLCRARPGRAPGWEAAGTETTELWPPGPRWRRSRAPGPRRERPYSFLARRCDRSGTVVASGTEINVEMPPDLTDSRRFVVALPWATSMLASRPCAPGIGIRTAVGWAWRCRRGVWDNQSTGRCARGVSLGVGCASVIFDIATAGKSREAQPSRRGTGSPCAGSGRQRPGPPLHLGL